MRARYFVRMSTLTREKNPKGLRLRGVNFNDTRTKWKWKTSLLKLLYRQERAGGQRLISLDGKPLEHWSPKETVAKQMAVVTQFNHCSLIVQLKKSSVGKNPHLFLQKEKERDYAPRSRCSSRWIVLRRNSSLFVSFRWEKTASLVGTCLGARTDSCSWMNLPITWYQVPVRLV